MLPLPLPVLGGSIEDLRHFVNVPNDDAFVLTVAFILAAMRAVGPYPVLSLHGAAGTAKSTFSEVIRRLVDPGKPMLRSLPRAKEDFFIAAHNNHVLAFENISYIPTWISDLMCQLATGGGHSRRELYTAMDETVFDAQRPQVLNGIEDFVIRGDLANRAIPLVLLPIEESKRRHERKFWAEFEEAAPKILGALLTAMANGLRHFPTTELEALPRMADFAIWATACETGAPWTPAWSFAEAYAENRAEATAVVLEDDTVAQSLRRFMSNRDSWKGCATDLLAELTKDWLGEIPDRWPKAGNKLSNRLRRVQPQLTAVEIEVKFSKTTDKAHGRVIEISKTVEGGSAAETSSPALIVRTVRSSEDEDNPGLTHLAVSSGGASGVTSGAAPAGDRADDGRTVGRTIGHDGNTSKINAQDRRTMPDDKGGAVFGTASGGGCARCGKPGTLLECTHKGANALVHRECLSAWLNEVEEQSLSAARRDLNAMAIAACPSGKRAQGQPKQPCGPVGIGLDGLHRPTNCFCLHHCGHERRTDSFASDLDDWTSAFTWWPAGVISAVDNGFSCARICIADRQ